MQSSLQARRGPNADFGFRGTGGDPSNLRSDIPAFPGAANAPPNSAIPGASMLYDNTGKRSNASINYHRVVPAGGHDSKEMRTTKDLKPGRVAMIAQDEQLGRMSGHGSERMSRLYSFAYLSSAVGTPGDQGDVYVDGRGFLNANTLQRRKELTKAYDPVMRENIKQMLQEESGDQVLLIPEMGYCFPRNDSRGPATTAFRSSPFLMWNDVFLDETGNDITEVPWLAADSDNYPHTRDLPLQLYGDQYNYRKKKKRRVVTKYDAGADVVTLGPEDRGALGGSALHERAAAFGSGHTGAKQDRLEDSFDALPQLSDDNPRRKACGVPIEGLRRTQLLWEDVYGRARENETEGSSYKPTDGGAPDRCGGLLTNRGTREAGTVGRFVPDGVVLYRFASMSDERHEEEMENRQNGVINLTVSGHALLTEWVGQPRPNPSVPSNTHGMPPFSAMRRLVTLPRDVVYIVVTGVVADVVDLRAEDEGPPKAPKGPGSPQAENGTPKAPKGPGSPPLTPLMISGLASFSGGTTRTKAVPAKGGIVDDDKVGAYWTALCADAKTGATDPSGVQDALLGARRRLVRRIVSIRYQRTTSRELWAMSNRRCSRKSSSFLGRREVILGAWRLGSVIDASASRPVLPSDSFGVSRTTGLAEMQGITISTAIRWVSSFELHDMYWSPPRNNMILAGDPLKSQDVAND